MTSAPVRTSLPPAPPIPRALQALLFWRRTVPFLDWCRRRCGDRWTLWVPPWGTSVFLSDPDDIKAAFAADPVVVHAGEAYAKVLGNLMGTRSLFLLDEEEHLRMRRLMLPPFHGERVQAYRAVIEEAAAAEVDTWPVGREMRLLEAMKRIALEVILRAVFGVTDSARLAALRQQLPQVVDPGVLLQLGWVVPALDRVGPWRRHRRLIEQTDQLLREEIEERRRAGDLSRRTDVLSTLIAARYDDGTGLSDAELIDELMTLLLAGHETTAAALGYAFERLLRHPPALATLREELAEEENSYLDAVIKETLRLRPIVFNAARMVTSPTRIAGHRLPAGTYVFPSITGVQRSEAHHDRPLDFRPERFMEGGPAPYTWIPFGGGRRRCLGAALAMLEMRVVLSTVLTRVELESVPGPAEQIQVKHVTSVPAGGAAAIVARRLVSPGDAWRGSAKVCAGNP